MVTIDIGTKIDLHKEIATRLLVVAGSGGGKSYLLRKHMEEAAGHVQQIVLDPEGEFVTLREKYPFVHIGKGGDIPLSVAYAETLANMLLETRISAIIDLYELPAAERIEFVARFLKSVMNAPRSLWHDCLFYIDEAHIFCPETGKAESMNAVIDLQTRGRKRGFEGILSTQRLSKLHKDAAAECSNKMIGRITLDIDRARAGQELGFANKGEILKLRDLSPGEFYAYGPAISADVIKFKVSAVTTTHLEAGRKMTALPPTPASISAILSKLPDIKEEAAKDLTTNEQLRAEVTRLRGELTRQEKPPGRETSEQVKKLEQLLADTNSKLKEELNLRQRLQRIVNECSKFASEVITSASGIRKTLYGADAVSAEVIAPAPQPIIVDKGEKPIAVAAKPRPAPERLASPSNKDGHAPLGKCAREILTFLCTYPGKEFYKVQVATAIGYSLNSGGFNNALGQLNTRGYILRQAGLMQVNTDRIKDITAELGAIEQTAYAIADFKANLGKCEREIYEVLLESPHKNFSKDALADCTATRYSANSGGFNNSLGRLNTLELIIRHQGLIKLNPLLIDYL